MGTVRPGQAISPAPKNQPSERAHVEGSPLTTVILASSVQRVASELCG